jgi:hypothetical protein
MDRRLSDGRAGHGGGFFGWGFDALNIACAFVEHVWRSRMGNIGQRSKQPAANDRSYADGRHRLSNKPPPSFAFIHGNTPQLLGRRFFVSTESSAAPFLWSLILRPHRLEYGAGRPIVGRAVITAWDLSMNKHTETEDFFETVPRYSGASDSEHRLRVSALAAARQWGRDVSMEFRWVRARGGCWDCFASIGHRYCGALAECKFDHGDSPHGLNSAAWCEADLALRLMLNLAWADDVAPVD